MYLSNETILKALFASAKSQTDSSMNYFFINVNGLYVIASVWYL